MQTPITSADANPLLSVLHNSQTLTQSSGLPAQEIQLLQQLTQILTELTAHAGSNQTQPTASNPQPVPTSSTSFPSNSTGSNNSASSQTQPTVASNPQSAPTSSNSQTSGTALALPTSSNPSPASTRATPPPALTPLNPAFHDSDPGVPNDAAPDGVPSNYSWYTSAASIGWGNNPPSDWKAITGWGQVYNVKGTHPQEDAPNTRVQLRNEQTWILSKSTHRWTEVQGQKNPSGAAFADDFGNNGSKGTTIKNESANGGGISVTAGDGYNFHFWPGDRASIDPTDIAGVYTKFEARLVLDNPNKTDDRSKAHYIASAGADYWRSQNAAWASDWSNNGGVGGGRFKTVTDDWQNFSMETLPANQLLQNPPPIT